MAAIQIGDKLSIDEKMEDLFDDVRSAQTTLEASMVAAQAHYHKHHRALWDYIFSIHPELRMFQIGIDMNAKELVVIAPVVRQ